MNATEARLATLRALAGYHGLDAAVSHRDVEMAALAEIAAIEAEARGGEKAAPPAPRFRVGQRVRVTKTGANCADVHEGDVVTVDDSDATGITTTTGWLIHNEYLEALPDESPAPPPARPQRIRITYDHYVEPNTKGAVVVPLEWDECGYPVVRGCEGTRLTLRANQWVPADEPEGEEANERERAHAAMDGDDVLRSDQREAGFIEGWLARAKVKS